MSPWPAESPPREAPANLSSGAEPSIPWIRAWARAGSSRTLFVQADRCWSFAPDPLVPPEPFADVAAFFEAHAGASVRIVLSSALTHQLALGEVRLPLNDEQAVADWARHQFVHYHGSVAQSWPLSAWSIGGQRGAAVLHGLDLAQMQRSAREHQVRLRAIQPWWSLALRAASKHAPALEHAAQAELWVVESELVTRIDTRAGHVRAIEQRWLDAATDEALARRMAELGVAHAVGHVLGYGLTTVSSGLAWRSLGLHAAPHPSAQWLAA